MGYKILFDPAYAYFDGLGSATDLTDSTGAAVESYSYDVYGLPSTVSNIGNPYLFTGRRYDEETDLYYYRARYYSPSIGRFLQTDPIGYYAGMNLYTYVNNNPVNWADPYGLRKDGAPGGVFVEGYMYGPDGRPIEVTGPEDPTPEPPKAEEKPIESIPDDPTPANPEPTPPESEPWWKQPAKIISDLKDLIKYLKQLRKPPIGRPVGPWFILPFSEEELERMGRWPPYDPALILFK